MLGVRYIKASPTTYVLQYRRGKVVREGAGLAFFFFEANSTIVQVPVSSRDNNSQNVRAAAGNLLSVRCVANSCGDIAGSSYKVAFISGGVGFENHGTRFSQSRSACQ